MEHNTAFLGNCWWGCSGYSKMPWGSPWLDDLFYNWKNSGAGQMTGESIELLKPWVYLGIKPLTKSLQSFSLSFKRFFKILIMFGNQTLDQTTLFLCPFFWKSFRNVGHVRELNSWQKNFASRWKRTTIWFISGLELTLSPTTRKAITTASWLHLSRRVSQ